MFSEFAELHLALSRSIAALPMLPPKLVLNAADDLADRYLNTKCTRYMLRADQVQEAFADQVQAQ